MFSMFIQVLGIFELCIYLMDYPITFFTKCEGDLFELNKSHICRSKKDFVSVEVSCHSVQITKFVLHEKIQIFDDAKEHGKVTRYQWLDPSRSLLTLASKPVHRLITSERNNILL